MELRRHVEVVWRFRVVVAAGLALGIALTLVSVFKVGSDGLSFRQDQVWSSLSTVYVTQDGFPEGRVLAKVPEGVDPGQSGASDEPAKGEPENQPFVADPARFANLTVLFSFLLSSDEIKGTINEFPAGAEILPAAIKTGTGSRAETLPLLQIDARAADPADAMRLNADAVRALERYVKGRQVNEGIVEDDRVKLTVVTPPQNAVVAEGRSYTAAIVLLLLCSLLGVGLAYVLENLNPSAGFAPVVHPGRAEPRRHATNGHAPFEEDDEHVDDDSFERVRPPAGHSFPVTAPKESENGRDLWAPYDLPVTETTESENSGEPSAPYELPVTATTDSEHGWDPSAPHEVPVITTTVSRWRRGGLLRRLP